MKIVCLTPWYSFCKDVKEGNFVLDSVESLRSVGHDVKVLVTNAYRPAFRRSNLANQATSPTENQPMLVRHPSIPRNFLRPVSNWLYDLFVSPELGNLLSSFRADVLHIHTELPAIAAVPVASRIGVPTVVTLHGINPHPRLNSRSHYALLHRTLSAADRVVLVGEPLRAFFSSIVGSDENFRVVPNGFRLPSDIPMRRLDPGKPLRLISVSNLHEGKGIDLTLKALSLLKSKGIENWRYSVVGGGYLRSQLEGLSHQLDLSDEVEFLGELGHSEVYSQLASADVFVLPSYREAFGIAYLEAMAFGLLSVGVEGQGPSAFIKDSQTGILVKPRDFHDLAKRLAEIMARPEEMLVISRYGQLHVLREFTWESHAKKLTELFGELLEKTR